MFETRCRRCFVLSTEAKLLRCCKLDDAPPSSPLKRSVETHSMTLLRPSSLHLLLRPPSTEAKLLRQSSPAIEGLYRLLVDDEYPREAYLTLEDDFLMIFRSLYKAYKNRKQRMNRFLKIALSLTNGCCTSIDAN